MGTYLADDFSVTTLAANTITLVRAYNPFRSRLWLYNGTGAIIRFAFRASGDAPTTAATEMATLPAGAILVLEQDNGQLPLGALYCWSSAGGDIETSEA